MLLSRLVVTVTAWTALIMSAPAATRVMPIDEVKPGMDGIGLTVFQGTTIEEFKVHVLGVLRATVGPRRDLILARLEGGPLAKTGVIAGMSGSPVYIDGRLVGAVSHSLGSFSTEAIAGITPFEEMRTATSTASVAATARRPFAATGRLTPAAMVDALRDVLGPVRPFAAPAEAAGAGTGPLGDPRLMTALRPIATPLFVSGFSPGVIEPVLSVFQQAGFVTVPGGGSTIQALPAPGGMAPLRPGDPVGVALMTGDLYLGATGTVTEVDGTRVYAFGHPFYNLGHTRFPMTRAFVHAVLPSLLTSMKLSSVGETIGTIDQDRATAIAGTLGPGPRTVRVTLSLEREKGERRQFRFDVADDPLLTPLLTFAALLNTFSSYERDLGTSSFAVRGTASVHDHGDVVFDDVYTGDQASSNAALSVVAPLAALMTNDREPVQIDSLHLDVQSTELPRVTTIERAWIDATDIRRGRTVPLKILLRNWRGDVGVHTIPIEIPLNAEGTLTVLVADGARFAQFEQRDGRPTAAPASVAALIKQLNQVRRSNRVYIRLLTRDAGAIVGTELLPSLPASVLAVLGGDRPTSGGSALQNATLGAWEIAVGQAVSGVRALTISLSGNTP